MTTVRTACRILATGSAILTASCQDDSAITSPSTTPAIASLRQEPAAFADPLLTHARAIPGFGGFFIDHDGTPTVYLKDPGHLRAAEIDLGPTLARLGASSSRLRVKRADYDYVQLYDWHTRTIPAALTVPGAVFADLDEGSNRLRFGVETAAAESGVRAAIVRLGIPGAAIVFERTAPIYPMARLRGKVAPRRGGLLIVFPLTDTTQAECTLGFNTRVSNGVIGFRSFVTASHCSRIRGVVDSTVYRQPTEQIGTEVADPPFFTTLPCPSGRRCRWSDAARVRYFTGPGSDLGGISRPVSRSLADGTRNIDPANPFFNITSELAPFQGVEVNKVGQRTGWTRATIGSTCVAVNVAKSDVTLFCQSRTTVGILPGVSRPGDSGSPVFYWSGGSDVALTGLLWGGDSTFTSFVFSPMSRIEQELGALKTF